MEHANGKHTAEHPQVHTTSSPAYSNVCNVCVISAGDTVPPGTVDDDRHVRSRHAHSRQDDGQTGNTDNADEMTGAGESAPGLEQSSDWMATLNLQTQQQDHELANIIDYLQNGNLPEDSKIGRRIALTKDQFAIRENVLYHLGTNRRKNNSSNQQIMEQICIPKHMANIVLARYLEQLMHCGYEKMYLTLKQRVYWTDTYADTRKYVSQCENCHVAKAN